MKQIKEFFQKNKKEIGLNGLVMLAAVLIVTGVFLYWSHYKIIWFCDEIYSYFTANSGCGVGARISYDTWYDSQFVVDDMSADLGKFFRRTINNVKADDHPPIYFMTMHMVSVLMKGSISKWVGLSINLICVIGICILAYLIFYLITRKKLMALMAAVALGILPSALTNAMLIRMYCMLTAWAMLYVFLSYLVMQEKGNKWVRVCLYLALSVTTAFGFLTQYYFAVFAVGFTAVYSVFCIVKKKWKKMGAYIVSMILAVGIATMLWEEWIDQIFYRYCGEEVLSQAADFSKIFKELGFGLTVMPKLMFYNFYWMGILLVIAGLILLIRKKDKDLPVISMLLGGTLFYSVIVAHVTPSFYLDYRYFYMPTTIAYIAVILIFVDCMKYAEITREWQKQIISKLGYIVLGILILFNIGTALFDEMSMGYVDRSGEYNRKREILKEYRELPWVYYGYESWSMMENYYDLALGTRFIVYNDMNDFDSKKCPANGEDFIFMINSTSYKDPDVVLEKLKETVGCEHEIEFMFHKGAAFYLIRHK